MAIFTSKPTQYSFVQHSGTVEELAAALAAAPGPTGSVARPIGESRPEGEAVILPNFGPQLTVLPGYWVGGAIGFSTEMVVLQPDAFLAQYDAVDNEA